MSARSSSRFVPAPRPGAALAAAVIGIVVGTQILIGSFVQLSDVVNNGMSWLVLLIAPIGVLWLVGGIRMLGGRRTVLLVGAVVWLVLMAAFVVWGWIGALADSGQALTVRAVMIPALVFAVVPVIVLRLAYRPAVTQWINLR